ncbi:receptor-like serine/threonine-protein kinase SD1-8 [Tanacetum coccineum]
MSANPVQHQRTKHIEIDIHFVRDKVAAGHVRVLHVPSRFQYTDIFTKGLPYLLFADFRSSLSIRKSLSPTAGALAIINCNQAISQSKSISFMEIGYRCDSWSYPMRDYKKDDWLGDYNLASMFPRLYTLEIEKDCPLSKRLHRVGDSQDWNWNWSRDLRNGLETTEFDHLMSLLTASLDGQNSVQRRTISWCGEPVETESMEHLMVSCTWSNAIWNKVVLFSSPWVMWRSRNRKQILERTYVWVANRDNPITTSSGKLTLAENGNIILVDQSETSVWSSNRSVPVVNTMAQLLNNGNFVLRHENDENPENYIWQSFDYPTDTLLPGMKLGWSRKTGNTWFLTSWKDNTDPGSGDYSIKMDVEGFPELVIWKNDTKTSRSGPWTGKMFSGTPEMKGVSQMSFEFVDDPDEIYYSFEMLNKTVYSRVLINYSGIYQRYIWVETTKSWNSFWFYPSDRCDAYGECGPFGVCDANGAPRCKCMTGFRPKDQQAWEFRDGTSGCERTSDLDCRSDGFLPMKNMRLPDGSQAFIDEKMNLSTCGEICRKNCSCAAYSNMDNSGGGSGCAIWEVDLMDMRQYDDSEGGGQDLYVKVAASDIVQSPTTVSSNDGSASGNHVVMITAFTVGGVFSVLIILLMLFYLRRRKLQRLKISKTDVQDPQEKVEAFLLNERVSMPSKRHYYLEMKMDELELPLFDFTTLSMATNNFSDANKLGYGGFGSVYKLKEKLLIYEFMENKSLNTFLFEKESVKLNWQIRFDIISGIARGLLYLHHDSRFKIIHRDLKASNILLDKEMNPKISDFGMARIFGRDQTEAETKKVVGTYISILFTHILSEWLYVPREIAMDGLSHRNPNVFSFGVLVLEIVSGQKNRGSSYTSSQLSLLGYTWMLWEEGNPFDLLDESLGPNYSEDEVLRCIQIGLFMCDMNTAGRTDTRMSKILKQARDANAKETNVLP